MDINCFNTRISIHRPYDIDTRHCRNTEAISIFKTVSTDFLHSCKCCNKCTVNWFHVETSSVERGICPIVESIMTDSVIFNAHVWNCLISTYGLKSDGRNGQDGQPASSCQISWWSVKPLPRYGNFSRWRPQPSWVFKIWNFLTVELRQLAKFRGDQSNRCWDMAIFLFFQDGGRAPSWICDERVWPLTKGIWWSLSLYKIWS